MKQSISPRDILDREYFCSKCDKDLMVPSQEGNIPVVGIMIGADIVRSGIDERDEATIAALELQFGRYEIGHYVFCMECTLKAMSRDNLPF